MQFCDDCGAILNLFEFPDRELCSDCSTKNEQPKPEPVVVEKPQTQDAGSILPDTVHITAEDGKISVTSEEGWILWSGEANKAHELQTILKRAERIYSIRSRTRKPTK